MRKATANDSDMLSSAGYIVLYKAGVVSRHPITHA